MFYDVNGAYSSFFQKIMSIIDKIVSYKNKRIKGNTFFDSKVLEKLNTREKLFMKQIKSYR